MLWCLLLLVMIAYSSAGFVAFGRQVEGFKSPLDSMMTLFEYCSGEFNFLAMQKANAIIGPVFTISFMLLVYLLLLYVQLILLTIQVIGQPAGQIQKLAHKLPTGQRCQDTANPNPHPKARSTSCVLHMVQGAAGRAFGLGAGAQIGSAGRATLEAPNAPFGESGNPPNFDLHNFDSM